ncbi:probable LRR receptor-like serine/threonine-protein kinase At3g47570 isoform X2 [Coffea eugenioides]|uniref:probable LRR receptor-like serine/threonine-protein kinase At3g47570 isoform X2 n=1 Tax=Coffea eugenioides TaxID=49369 RepID=UPI000F612EBF|nr:probable LRR receptor-like serine/threonine-protein kinase At3g47570 isoform X2 [Coffea eugenioides]
MPECEALRKIRRRNLVKIITSFSSIDFRGNEFKALVYGFMANGSLENWLHPNSSNLLQPKNLNFIWRLNIAVDVASALEYIHHCCEIPPNHRDIKPSNLLLTEQLCAHLSDFGFARRCASHKIERCLASSFHVRVSSSAQRPRERMDAVDALMNL